MAAPHERLATAITALTLAILTLGVFSANRQVGPEAAVREFESAALSADWSRVTRAVVDPPESPALRAVANRMRVILENRPRISYGKRVRDGNFALVEATYRTRQGEEIVIIWVVALTPTGWRVACGETLELLGNPRVRS